MSTKKPEHPMTEESISPAAEQLIVEFKSLMADAEALIHATEGHADGALGSIRAKALDTLASAKESLSGIEGQLTDKAKLAAANADDFVHRKPWEAVGVAAGLGLLIGLLLHRR